jgi:hypothetical protein
MRENMVGIDVEKRWREWLSFEENIIKNYGKMKQFTGNFHVVCVVINFLFTANE